MGGGHSHRHARTPWGHEAPGVLGRWTGRLRSALGIGGPAEAVGLGGLPPRLRRDPLAPAYRAAERAADHREAAALAARAMDTAIGAEDWWVADAWGHRALWHYEQADMTLEATRQARRIGDLRWAAGDPASARRYYAEAIDEARDIGAEHEQGLAALGLGRALLDLGSVSQARRLASASVTLLERAGASPDQIGEARRLLGDELAVGETDGGHDERKERA